MLREGTIIFRDLIGMLEVLHVECVTSATDPVDAICNRPSHRALPASIGGF